MSELVQPQRQMISDVKRSADSCSWLLIVEYLRHVNSPQCMMDVSICRMMVRIENHNCYNSEVDSFDIHKNFTGYMMVDRMTLNKIAYMQFRNAIDVNARPITKRVARQPQKMVHETKKGHFLRFLNSQTQTNTKRMESDG